MNRALETGILVAAGAAVIALGRRRLPGRLLSRLRRTPPPSGVDERVARELRRLTPSPVHVTVERGGVVLTGHVRTDERGTIVRELAGLEGVDSVTDLMTEHRDLRDLEAEALVEVTRRGRAPARRAAGLVTAGAGAGLAVAGARLGGRFGRFAETAGLALVAVGAVATVVRRVRARRVRARAVRPRAEPVAELPW